MLAGLGHVDLVCRDIDRSLAFYAAVFGDLGLQSPHEERGERGETIHYLRFPQPGSGSIGLRQRHSGLDTVIARPFPHIGPGQDERFAIASFAGQIAAIERGAPPVLRVGNLDARRDFSDVRDVVDAYLAMIGPSGGSGTFNVCSGRALRIGDVLDALLALAEVEIEVVTPAMTSVTACVLTQVTPALRAVVVAFVASPM